MKNPYLDRIMRLQNMNFQYHMEQINMLATDKYPEKWLDLDEWSKPLPKEYSYSVFGALTETKNILENLKQ